MGAVLTGRERNYHYNCALGSTRAANRQLAWTPILGSFGTLRRGRRMEEPGATRMASCRGDPLVFSERKQHGLSIEYTLSSPGVSLSSLLCCTLAVWTVTYPVSTYAQAPALLASATVIVMLGILVYLHWIRVQHESILVISGTGVQLSTCFASGRCDTHFIEMDVVQDIVINEGIHRQAVIYYLCVLVRNNQKNGLKAILPVFLAARPRLDCLRKVYRGCQEILHTEPNISTCVMDR
uniref:Phosphatidylinositol glycan anchor biosynthesis, class H n=1 Tax=Eptatretus burgeri TaxID=7764 RepID=A0A8C4Q7T6_EPTBU